MIKVLGKAFRALELLNENGEMGVNELAEALEQKVPAMYQILRTMISLGYVERSPAGAYALGDKIRSLTYPDLRRSRTAEIANLYSTQLSSEIRECTVVGVLHRGSKYLIAHSIFNRSLMVASEPTHWLSVYDKPTSRVLLAHASTEELDVVIAKNGLPGADWPEVTTRDQLLRALEKIRHEPYVMQTRSQGQVVELATPVFGPDRHVWAALGVYLPAARFVDDRREHVLERLVHTAEDMGHALTVTGPRPEGVPDADAEE